MTKRKETGWGWIAASLLLTLCALPAAAGHGSVPGWFQAGSDSDGYEIGTVQTDEGRAAYIKSLDPEPGKFGTLMQSFSPTEYLGKRVRLSARVKSQDVAEWAGMWMRADRDKETVAFDNMQTRPIRGSTDWTRCSIVLDIPGDADSMSMGILLHGKGEIIWDKIELEIVGRDVPVTSPYQKKSKPTNLDFEN